MNVMLWPLNPQEESWISDVPNEGLYFDADGESIVDTFADYQGKFLIDPLPDGNPSALMFVEVHLTPTQDQQYLEAYKIILEEFACCWRNPLPPEANWEVITGTIIQRLKVLGWQEVEYNEAEGIWKVIQ